MGTDRPRRIAMWSGPRNISTAMMRSWGNRPDTVVCDEPLYAHYLRATGLEHPGAAEVLEDQENDWRKVVAGLTGDIPLGKRVYYQKQMTHHLLPEIGRDWLDRVEHLFLIRNPASMLISLADKLGRFDIQETGLPQQLEIFDWATQREGRVPPVIDSEDVLADPEGVLRSLCSRIDLPFYDEMLSWPPGIRETDGIWAKHWYENVSKTTGFVPPPAGSSEPPKVPDSLKPLLEPCFTIYETLRAHRIQPSR